MNQVAVDGPGNESAADEEELEMSRTKNDVLAGITLYFGWTES